MNVEICNLILRSSSAVPVNPFKNPFQSQQQQHQQSYQNWTIPESQSQFNGFGSPVNGFGSPVNTNGFYFNHNNGIISPQSAFGKGGFGNPFVVSWSKRDNFEMDDFNKKQIFFSYLLFRRSRQTDRQAQATRFYETWKWQEFSCTF